MQVISNGFMTFLIRRHFIGKVLVIKLRSSVFPALVSMMQAKFATEFENFSEDSIERLPGLTTSSTPRFCGLFSSPTSDRFSF